VRQDRLHPRWLAHHAQRRLQARLIDVLDQALGAEAADFLVIADEQVQRPHELARLHVGHSRQTGRDEALHIGRPSCIEASIGGAQGEWIGAPGLTVHRHGIDMA
jgi:hypothetical protein